MRQPQPAGKGAGKRARPARAPGEGDAPPEPRSGRVAGWLGRINALLHSTDHGRADGRKSRPHPAFHINPGRFDPARENVIVGVHETSRTGAPILAWNIVRHLASRYNVFTIRLGDGALTREFEALSAEVHGPFAGARHHPIEIEHGLRALFSGRVFRYAIVNGAESRLLVEVCARRSVPTLLLMHEFASLVQPRDSLRSAFDQATEIVVPGPLVARAAEDVHPALRNRHLRVLPQGVSVVPNDNSPGKPFPTALLERLSRARMADGAFLAIGAGTVELRKGVDLFLATAAAVKRGRPARPVHFVWVGHGYRPDEKPGFSVYLREQLRRSSLQDDVTFLDEVSDLEPLYALADLFLLTSRLDPLPNVSIDAAYRGIPIVCFKDASGIADLMQADPDAAGGVVDYLDTHAAAQVIIRLASDGTAREKLAQAVSRLAHTTFDMERYVGQLDGLGIAAARGADPGPRTTGGWP